VDYHCGSSNPVAARLFRPEHQSKIPANRQLDSHAARNRGNTRRIEPPWGNLNRYRAGTEAEACTSC
jgi:hypothetical protein